MEILGIFFASLTFIFLTLAVYFYVSRDLERYHRRVEERLQKLIDERGPAVVSQRDIQELKQELLSDIPVFHQLLLRFEVFNRLQAILRQADDIGHYWTKWNVEFHAVSMTTNASACSVSSAIEMCE